MCVGQQRLPSPGARVFRAYVSYLPLFKPRYADQCLCIILISSPSPYRWRWLGRRVDTHFSVDSTSVHVTRHITIWTGTSLLVPSCDAGMHRVILSTGCLVGISGPQTILCQVSLRVINSGGWNAFVRVLPARLAHMNPWSLCSV